MEPPSVSEAVSSQMAVPATHVVDWLWLVWEHRRFVGKAAFRGLMAAILIALILPTHYTSTVRLMPPDQSSSGGMLAALASSAMGGSGGSGAGGVSGMMSSSLGGIAGDMLGVKTSGALFIELLKSRTVQDALINQFDLRRLYWDRYYEQARKDLSKRTTVEEDKKSGVLTISVNDGTKQRAQQMSQAYVDELNRLVSQVSTSSARREREFLEQRLRSVRQQLEKDSVDLSEYSSNNTVVDLPSQAKSMVEAAAVLQGELIAAQSELRGLEQIYTPDNVRAKSMRARVDELRQQLARMGGTSSAPGQSADGQAGKATDELYPSLKQLPLLGVRWLDLYRQVKIEETVFELLTRQFEIAKVQEAKEIPTVKILDPPDFPERASFPPRIWIVLLGTLLSAMLAVVWIIAVRKWQTADRASPVHQLAVAMVSDVRASWRSIRNKPDDTQRL